MKRLKGIQDGEGGWLVRIVFRFLRLRDGKVPNPLRIYAYRPPIMRAFLALARKIRRPGKLPDRLKRLAMYWTSRTIECAF